MVLVEVEYDQLEDGEAYLTDMKHGFIEGVWCADEQVFRGYYWHDLEWTANRQWRIPE